MSWNQSEILPQSTHRNCHELVKYVLIKHKFHFPKEKEKKIWKIHLTFLTSPALENTNCFPSGSFSLAAFIKTTFFGMPLPEKYLESVSKLIMH